MCSSFSAILIILTLLKVAIANIDKATFYTKFKSAQDSGLIYKRMASLYFGPVPPNLVQCAFICTKEDNCKSVYIDGEACVFGVYDIATFVEGQVVTPDHRQDVKIIGTILWT